jgi:hypothetical protein
VSSTIQKPPAANPSFGITQARALACSGSTLAAIGSKLARTSGSISPVQ